MKLTNPRWIGLLALAVFPLYSGYSDDSPAPAAPPATPPPAPVANAPTLTIAKPSGDLAEVLKLTKAGMGEDVILAYIKNSRTFFNLSANDILHLKDEGVSSKVLTEMLTHDHALHIEGPNTPPQFTYNQHPYPPGSQPPAASLTSPPAQPDSSAVVPPLVPGPSTAPDGSQPPPPETEAVPVAPGADYYWAPGYWSWNGGWIWVGGFWYPRAWGWGWGWHGGWRGGWGGHGGFGGGLHGGGGGFGRSSGGHR